jgi:hypothetical protein
VIQRKEGRAAAELGILAGAFEAAVTNDSLDWGVFRSNCITAIAFPSVLQPGDGEVLAGAEVNAAVHGHVVTTGIGTGKGAGVVAGYIHLVGGWQRGMG